MSLMPRNNKVVKKIPRARMSGMMRIALSASVCSVLALFALFPQFSSASVTVNNEPCRFPSATTYQQLREQGYLSARQGNLLAVDGSVIETGAGKYFCVYADGEMVQDLNVPIKKGAVITESDGQDVTEESIVQEIYEPAPVRFDGTDFNFYRGTLHMVVENGSPGVVRTMTGVTSGVRVDYVVSEPATKVYRSVSPLLASDRKVIALTFDDGPNPYYTPMVLEVLRDNNAKATFFMLGTETDKYGSYALAVKQEGHLIASHTYSHKPSNYLSRIGYDATVRQLADAASSIEKATGVHPNYVRPPGGYMNLNTVLWGGEYADAYVGWTIDTKDYSSSSTVDGIVNLIVKNAKPGSVILMHDGGGDRSKTVRVLKIVLPKLRAMGYEFITIDELVAIRREELGLNVESAPVAALPHGKQQRKRPH